MKYQFYTCDVFTDTRFGGNPLAVLPNAEGLTDQQMQQVAREFNYSETTFVLPGEKGYAGNIRIFTPATEVPFAGHPNIGTAFVLANSGALGNIDTEINIIFEEKAGLVPVRIGKKDDNFWCELKAPEDLSIGKTISIDLVASALSLSSEDIVTNNHQPQVASVGFPFIMAELKTRDALESIGINLNVFEDIYNKGVMPDIHVYTISNDEFDIRSRMFGPMDGVPEDPATGSANCALAAMLTHYKAEADGEFNWHITQGVEMNRPSVLDARTVKKAGNVTGVWIAGNCVMVSEGYIEI
ncbi:PhzF family phenazine biosynthesis protein [Thermodesulfobacteriota bacterium]